MWRKLGLSAAIRPTRSVLAAGVATAFLLLSSPGAAQPFPAGEGLADPGLSMNALPYYKWGQSVRLMFIDRMKGAFGWSGKRPMTQESRGGIYIFDHPGAFQSSSAALELRYDESLVFDIEAYLLAATFRQKSLQKAQYEAIRKNPEDYFKLETDASGRSMLSGRLSANGSFTTLVRFDRDIGRSLDELREAGQVILVRGDRNINHGQLALDKNGWPLGLPQGPRGASGEISTIVMWYPRLTGRHSDSPYAGDFMLLADGTGVLDLTQRGAGSGGLAMRDVRINGPSAIPFRYSPNGQRVELSIRGSDPAGEGDYLRNVRIVHRKHWKHFEAGMVFAPEFHDFVEDYRILRWMKPMEGQNIVPAAAGRFEDRPGLDYFTYNLGHKRGRENGVPVEAIVAFANQTGTDPWITVPINASDDYVRGMARLIAQQLDPARVVYVELGNEIWNPIFDPNQYAKIQAQERWGLLEIERGPDGKYRRDGRGKPIVRQLGRFVSPQEASANGYRDLDALARDLNMTKPLLSVHASWMEWAAMRGAQVGRMFETEFQDVGASRPVAQVHNVMAAFTHWPRSNDFLFQAKVWREEEPDAWINPAEVFESLAVGGYFGAYLGSRESDLVGHWLKQWGEEATARMVVRHLRAGIQPGQTFIRIEPNNFGRDGRVASNSVVRDVNYGPDLIVDVFDAIERNNATIRKQLREGQGVQTGKAVLAGPAIYDHVRLAEENGVTVLQLRPDPRRGNYETVLAFDRRLSVTIDEMVADGTLFVRSLRSLREDAGRRFRQNKVYADKYNVDLLAYEGGQHMAAAIWSVYRRNLKNPVLIKFLKELNERPEIAGLYQEWFDQWRAAGGRDFVHYADYDMPSRFGNWGLITYLGEKTRPDVDHHKLRAVEAWNAKGPWWPTNRPADAFLQGKVVEASGDIVGTQKPDILIGGPGNDRIAGGPGGDGLHSGGGADMLDGGDGDDVLVIVSGQETVAGGAGDDRLRLSIDLTSVDFAAVKATGIETIDLRNFARTTATLSAADVARIGGGHLTLMAETADTLRLNGLIRSGGSGATALYTGSAGGQTVSLSVQTDIPPPVR